MTADPQVDPPEVGADPSPVQDIGGQAVEGSWSPGSADQSVGAAMPAPVVQTGVDEQAEPRRGLDATAMWRLVAVVDVAVQLPTAYPEVVLRETSPPFRTMRIPVGMAEGTAIAYAWRRMATPRPLTHQLLVDLLDRHNVRVEAVRVTAVHDGVFQGELDTTSRIGRQVVSCRPSDAVAIALRQQPPVPILVADWVLSDAQG